MASKIYVGSLSTPDYLFDDESIFSVRVNQKVALVGQTFSYDTLTTMVADDVGELVNITRFRTSDNKEIELSGGQIYSIDYDDSDYIPPSQLLNVPYGTPVWYYNGNSLIGKFYLDSVSREGKNLYKLECISVVGILDKLQHGGGLFQGSTFGAVLAHILATGLHGTGNSVIEYEIEPDVANLSVSGWLPYATKRENLYQLLFAYGVNIVKNYDGNPRFTFLYTAPENPSAISEDIVFDEGSVIYTRPYSGVSVSEHVFTAVASESSVALFDNTNGTALISEEVWFTQAPVIVSTLSASSGLTIVSATENSAVLSGSGVLTGIPYVHTTRIVTKVNSNSDEKKNIDVTNCTMVNAINSNNLVNRLYAYYCPEDKIKEIKGGFVYTNERCGKMYSFKNKFGDTEIAFLSSLDLNTSSFVRANGEFCGNYDPVGQAGLYKHVDILVPVWNDEQEEYVYTGTWEVPDDVTEFKVVLISGGVGGFSGYPGENGSDGRAYTNLENGGDISAMWYGADGGAGGSGGDPGGPGRVKVFTVENATPGDTYDYEIGEGGEGGDETGFIPDTRFELRSALENENPDAEYTDADIDALIAQEETDWNGNPNVGSNGTASSFTDGTNTWSTADNDGFTPTGGVYEPIGGEFYALVGYPGLAGAEGGARKYQSGITFNWVTDGKEVKDEKDATYLGGATGLSVYNIPGLESIKAVVYGGNGAGASIGVDRDVDTKINGEDCPARLIIQYSYQGEILPTKHIHLLPDGYEYEIDNIYPSIPGEKVFYPTNANVTGTMSTNHTDKTITESTNLALDYQNKILSIYSVDSAELDENNVLELSGEVVPTTVYISGPRSGRHNDPLKDTSYSYTPSQPEKQTMYGGGGHGGHGGGGGAGASSLLVYEMDEETAKRYEVKPIIQSHGYGGGGGQGGQGGDGCILVYY